MTSSADVAPESLTSASFAQGFHAQCSDNDDSASSRRVWLLDGLPSTTNREPYDLTSLYSQRSTFTTNTSTFDFLRPPESEVNEDLRWQRHWKEVLCTPLPVYKRLPLTRSHDTYYPMRARPVLGIAVVIVNETFHAPHHIRRGATEDIGK